MLKVLLMIIVETLTVVDQQKTRSTLAELREFQHHSYLGEVGLERLGCLCQPVWSQWWPRPLKGCHTWHTARPLWATCDSPVGESCSFAEPDTETPKHPIVHHKIPIVQGAPATCRSAWKLHTLLSWSRWAFCDLSQRVYCTYGKRCQIKQLCTPKEQEGSKNVRHRANDPMCQYLLLCEPQIIFEILRIMFVFQSITLPF